MNLKLKMACCLLLATASSFAATTVCKEGGPTSLRVIVETDAKQNIVSATEMVVRWTIASWQGSVAANDGKYVVPVSNGETLVFAGDLSSVTIDSATDRGVLPCEAVQ